MDVAITRISSKGQVVIPVEMREGFAEGDKLLLIKDNDNIIMKRTNKLNKNFEDDLDFAKRTAASWKKYEKGEFKEMEFDDFISEMKKW